MATKIHKLGVQAGITAGRMIVAGARLEIEQRLMASDAGAERFAVRRAARLAIEELYFEGLTPAAQERLRRVKAPFGRTYLTGHDALIDLAGWESIP